MRCFARYLLVSSCLFFASLLGIFTASAADTARDASPASEPIAAVRYGDLPLHFEANQGQSDPQVRFLSRGSGYSFFLTQTGALMTFARDSRASAAALQMQLAGASPHASIRGLDPLPGKSNYFAGSDSSLWRTGVPTYSKVEYDNVYPGINLVYYGNQRQLEYDFVVAAGADPQQIRLAVSGAQTLTVDAQGNLVLHSIAGDVQLLAPKVYQQIHGHDHQVSGQWALTANNVAGFRLGRYDHKHPLVIDPVLTYSSFLGGSQKSALSKIVVDAAGNAYVAGYTASGDFPAAPTPQAVSFGGGTPSRGAFVAKIDPTGSTLLYATYLSGSADEEGTGLAVDNSGNVYLSGTTHSTDFPTRNAFQSTCATHTQAGTCSSAFLTKISSTGDSLIFSTYLGGTGGESARSVAIDATGSAYIAGVTSSLDFPVTSGAAQTKCAGTCQQNGFVAKFNPAGTALAYATYIGGSGTDDAADIAVDASGNAYLAGRTTSADFPLAVPYQKSCIADATSSSGACVATAFVTKIKADGSAFAYSTYLGGTLGSQASAIAVDSIGSAYVTGSTQSSDFPVMKPFQKSCGIDAASGHCSVDAFLTKFSPSGKTLVYSTYLGGSGHDEAFGIALDSAGNAHIAGHTESADFPTVASAQKQLKGSSDAFIARFNPAGSALTFSTYHGGSATESGNGLALDAKGNVYLTGATTSTDFPTSHPFQSSCAGTCASAFVTKMSVPPPAGQVLAIAKSHTGNFTRGQTGATYTITVSNTGTGPTSGAVTVTDTLPTGLTATAMAGTGWGTCTLATLTCTRSDALAAGSSYPDITLTVDVANNAPASVTNSVQVSGGGAATASTTDPTTIVFPVLAIVKSHTGNFTQGQTGLNYTITVSNNGTGPTSGTVTVVDTLPGGVPIPLTATAISGTGWTCTLATLTCTRSNALAVGSSYPNITLTVDVANTATVGTVTNSVTGSGGNSANASTTDPTVILPAPVLSVAKAHTGVFTLGGTGVWTITVGNTAASNSVTYGTLTVTDVLPSGAGYTYTLASSSGTNWSCVTSGTTTITVTCTDSVDTVSGGSNFPVLTLNVHVPGTSPATVSNTATASGAGALSSASGSDNNVPVGFPLGITKTDSGNFIQGRTGVTYTISGMKNNGNTATTGTVTVADTLPSGLTATAMSGTGWSCTLATTTCTRSDALAAGASYPAITLTVTVANNAPASVTNSVTISESGVSQSATATDPTTILPAPVLSIAKTHTGTFTQGSTGDWLITVSNTAASNSLTYGTLTVTDTLPSGTNNGSSYTYTLASGTGTNWGCTTSGTTTVTVTCTDSTDAVGGGASFPVLTLTANIPNTSPASVSNCGTASGAGALSSSAPGCDNNVPIKQVPKTINLISGSPQSAVVLNPFANPLVVQVLDAASVGINNISVSFNSPSSGASATPNPATATTQTTGGNAGTATTSLTANGIYGSYQVTATVSGVTSPPFALTNTDYTLTTTPTIYIQGQSSPIATTPPTPPASVAVIPLPTPSATQPSYSGTVDLTCSSTPAGVSCTSITPASETFSDGTPSGSNPAVVALSVAGTTPVGLYNTVATAPVVRGNDVAHSDTRSASFSLAVQCTLSLNQIAPLFTPQGSIPPGGTTAATANQYSIGVSVQAGSSCPYGDTTVAGNITPGSVSGDGTVATSILTATHDTANAGTSQTVTFTAGTATSSAQSGQVNVPYFDATQSNNVNPMSLPVELEAPIPVTVTSGVGGAKTGTATVTPTQAGTGFTIPNIGPSSTVCGVLDATGNPDTTGNNFGFTCAWSSTNTVTVTYQPPASAMNNGRVGPALWFAFVLPAMVFLGSGFSLLGPRRGKKAQKRVTVLLGLLLVITLSVLLPSCGGGFSATFLQSGTGTFTLNVMGYTSDSSNPVKAVEIFTIPVTIGQ